VALVVDVFLFFYHHPTHKATARQAEARRFIRLGGTQRSKTRGVYLFGQSVV